MAKTYAQQLDDVQAAIDAIEQRNQSYTINGRSMTHGDLKTLYAERKRLTTLVAREARGGGVRIRYGVPAP